MIVIMGLMMRLTFHQRNVSRDRGGGAGGRQMERGGEVDIMCEQTLTRLEIIHPASTFYRFPYPGGRWERGGGSKAGGKEDGGEVDIIYEYPLTRLEVFHCA